MESKRMKRLFVLLASLLLLGCTSQEAHLIYLPETTPTPVAQVTPTPPPEAVPIVVEPIDGAGFAADLNGIPIIDERTHYYEYYLSVDNLRIYEENGETLLDAVITNNYPKTLTGGLSITFYRDGIKYAYADFYTADGGLTLVAGENLVYADVLTEVDVQMMDFEIGVTTPFLPEG